MSSLARYSSWIDIPLSLSRSWEITPPKTPFDSILSNALLNKSSSAKSCVNFTRSIKLWRIPINAPPSEPSLTLFVSSRLYKSSAAIISACFAKSRKINIIAKKDFVKTPFLLNKCSENFFEFSISFESLIFSMNSFIDVSNNLSWLITVDKCANFFNFITI